MDDTEGVWPDHRDNLILVSVVSACLSVLLSNLTLTNRLELLDNTEDRIMCDTWKSSGKEESLFTKVVSAREMPAQFRATI